MSLDGWLKIAAAVVVLVVLGIGVYKSWPEEITRFVQWVLRPILRRILRSSE